MADAKGGLLASVYPVSCASTDGQNGTDPCAWVLVSSLCLACARGADID